MPRYVLVFACFILPLLYSPLLAQQKRNVAQPKRNAAQQKRKEQPKQPKRNVVQQPKQNTENSNPIVKLNNEQKRHLKIYRDISNAVASGKFNRNTVFQKYYELFSSSAEELVSANRDKADEMKIRSSQALDSNNEVFSKKCNEAAALYNEMADEIVKLPELYKAGKKAQMDASLKIYLSKEADLIKLGAKPCPRRWLSTKEAEACLIALNKTTAKTTR